MMGNLSPVRGDVVEGNRRVIRLVGAGAAAMTVKQGVGFAMSRIGAGDHKITWSEKPGNYVGVLGWSLQSATMVDLKNFSVIFKDPDASNNVEFTIFNAAGTAVDLSTAQTLTLEVGFKYSSL